MWTINRGVLTIPHDMAFVMDYISGEAERNPVYGAKMWNHDKPIITSDTTEGWPPHVHAFPFGGVPVWPPTPALSAPPWEPVPTSEA